MWATALTSARTPSSTPRRPEGGIYIGAGTAIAAQCYIIDMDHGLAAGRPVGEQENSVSPVAIGRDVWIAADCTVLKGSVVGDGAVVGAKSLVKGTLDSEGIYVGSPARLLRYKE